MHIRRYEPKERTLTRVLADKASEHGDKVYMYWRDDSVTYRQMDEASSRVARSLKGLGIMKGQNVAIMLPNCPEYLYVWFGANKIGAVEVPLNTAYRGDILKYVLNNCEARVLFVSPEYLDRLIAVQDQLEKLETVVLHDPERRGATLPNQISKFNVVSFDAFVEQRTDFDSVDVFPYDVSAIIYTSGTTGPSKGAMRTHQQFYCVSWGCANHMRYGPDDILYTCLPLFHGNAQALTALPALFAGCSWACGDRFSASRFWDDIRRYKCTAFNALGSVIYMLYKQPPKPGDREHLARKVLTAPAPIDIFYEFQERFNVKLIEVFGLTEGGTFIYNPLDAQRPGSCGKPLPGYHVRIVDDYDYEVPVGEEGEIIVRHDEPWSLMTGYYAMPDETLKSFRNQWYHTGDYGRQDSDGYYYFIDRKKDSLRRRGENISSFEIEKAVNSHVSVLEAAAVAVPSDVGEDDVKIIVVLKEGQSVKPEELVAHCEGKMAYFAVPRYVEFIDQMPKTPNEKIRKDVLRARGLTASTWDREKAGYKLKQ